MPRSKAKRAACALLGLLALAAAVQLALVEPRPEHAFFAEKEPVIIAHRGGKGLAPENTLEAMRTGIQAGAHLIEFDLRATRDLGLVAMHDETVDRTTDGTGAVSDLTLAQIRALDAGYRFSADGGRTFPFRGKGIGVPTLEEILAAFPGQRLLIDLKETDREVVARVAEVVADHGAGGRVLLTSFHDVTNRAWRELMPEAVRGTGEDATLVFYIFHRSRLMPFYRPTADALQVPEFSGRIRVLTPGFVRDAQAKNMRVYVWTIDDPADMRRFLAMGVDGVITGYPDRMAAVLAQGLPPLAHPSPTLRWIQAWASPSLDTFFIWVTRLGHEEFYLIALPLIYWVISKRWGLMLTAVFLLSHFINTALKNFFAIPRPTGAEGIRILYAESAPGWAFPSGHTQGTAVFWGYGPRLFRHRLLGWLGLIIIALVAVSRMYLGVHWPQDILGGLVLAAAITVVALRAERSPAWARLAALSPGLQIALAFAAPLLLLLLDRSLESAKVVGFLAGLLGGWALERKLVDFPQRATPLQHLARLIIGYGGLFALRVLTRAIFAEAVLPQVARYVTMGLWVVLVAPALFVLLRLYRARPML
jgi:glycerophosphoryl diester phosphodiesterase